MLWLSFHQKNSEPPLSFANQFYAMMELFMKHGDTSFYKSMYTSFIISGDKQPLRGVWGTLKLCLSVWVKVSSSVG